MTTSTHHHPAPTLSEPKNGFAITALVLAIVGMVMASRPSTNSTRT